MTNCLFSSHQSPSEKVSTLKGKHLLPKGSKFIPIRVDPFSEDRQHQFDKLKSLLPTETASILLRHAFCFYFMFYSPFKNISLISSRSFIKLERKLKNPGKNPLTICKKNFAFPHVTRVRLEPQR